MKEVFVINDSTVNKITYYHLLGILATLPFDRFFSQVILISLAIHTLIHVKNNPFTKTRIITILVSASVFFITLAGITYSPEKENGSRELVRQLAILIFPLIYACSLLDLKKYLKNLLLFFSLVYSVTLLFLFGTGLQQVIAHQLPVNSLFSPDFINHNFSAPIGMHATHLSMYVSLCLTSSLVFLVSGTTAAQRIFYTIVILILAAGLIVLSSRAVFIATGICIVLLPFWLLQGRKRIRFLLITVVFSAIALFAILKIDAFRKRYITDFRKELLLPANKLHYEPRHTRWSIVWDLVKKSPVIGYGSGTEKKLLKEKYFEEKLFISYINSLDAHNQYLSIWLKTGIIGLMLFLFTLIYCFKQAIRKRDIFFTSFLILITVVSMSENVLDVNKGIFFYGFFLPLFIFQYQWRKENDFDLPGN